MNMKKLISMVLALVMLLSMMAPAMADETTYTLTLNKAQEGHTYTAYQIFTGDLHEGVLSDIVWGNGVSAEGQTALGNAATLAAGLETVAQAEAFAASVAPYLSTAAGSVTIAEGATSGTISGLPAGYYLVKTTGVTETNDVYTYYILKVVKDTEANVKADVPEVEKTVNDNDANIGDVVTFTLTTTMTSNLQGYETYKVVFHDTLSAGLDFVEDSVKVTVAGVDKTSAFAVTEENGVLTISCTDVLAQGATAGSQIVVTYDAIVDSDAVIGSEGNPNKVNLEYSNDPNWNGNGEEPTGDTPEDEVKVYTWEIPVFKYTMEDDVKTPLAGAGFTLYTDEDCTQAVNLVAAGNNEAGVPVYKVCKLVNCEHDEHVTQIITDNNGKFEIEGLEQDTYYLKETTTPAGYNTCENVTVVIGANGALTVKETTVPQVEILNSKGATLPETGAQGTKMIYIVGGILVAAAAILLITKRRMNAAE